MAALLWRGMGQKILTRRQFFHVTILQDYRRFIKQVIEGFHPRHQKIGELLKNIEESNEYVRALTELRNEVKHETGSYFDDFPSEKILEDMKKSKISLEKFLWKTQCITKMPLIYLRKPLEYSENLKMMKYEACYCMGSDQHYEMRYYYVTLGSIHENMKVCVCIDFGDEENHLRTLMPLYPLVVTFSMKPRPQVYMHHDYDSIKKCYNFFHVINDKKIVIYKDFKELFEELDRRINHGILTND